MSQSPENPGKLISVTCSFFNSQVFFSQIVCLSVNIRAGDLYLIASTIHSPFIFLNP